MPHAHRAALELLESRTLFAAAPPLATLTYDGETAVVTGTDRADRIHVRPSASDADRLEIVQRRTVLGTMPAFLGRFHFHGGPGNDRVVIDAGPTTSTRLFGGPGKDAFFGGDGSDWMEGGDGNDRLDGRGGGNSINGGEGNDLLLGGDGGDGLYAGNGNDTLRAGAGRDDLNGGLGRDRLFGGTEADAFASIDLPRN